ncbi:uncharacterized protein VP01_11259g1, partial [Puccinia sorghi]
MTHAANIMKLLKPLSEATKILCGSTYPTLNTVLPVYLFLIQQLYSVQRVYAIKKPVYICAMILDPKFKTTFSTLLALLKSTTKSTKPQPSSYFASKLYQLPPNVCGVPAKINQYLKEDNEPKGVKVLTYWANRHKTFPHLAKMACCFLSSPATS